ncbi:MAG TPA: carboxypeptidase-like regulatory domain-containing protein [Longimicrobium sp.]|nr:carboxypeptidase-like regulatory domain-containing protein [Longimicrobium sp.]
MRRIRIPRFVAPALGLVLVVSCENPMCGCTPARDEAVLYGRVTDAAGNPVSNALVRAEEGPAECSQFVHESGWATANAAGHYRAEIYTIGGSVECLRAFALPPAGSTLRGSDTVAFQVRFAPRTPVDSARVDLVLRAP